MATLQSKMKKSDPSEFTIHDFLAECKASDSADSRFEKSGIETNGVRNSFVVGVPPTKLGNVYSGVATQLAGDEKEWIQKKDSSGRFHLILGGPRGAGIPFKRFAQLFKWDYGIVPHCNCFRGHVWLTQKVKLAQTLRQAELQDIMPQSFLYFPASAEDNETEALRDAAGGGESKYSASSDGTWIAKASDATRGERTIISNDCEEIISHLESQEKTSAPWCIQRYISNPLLLPGDRKFDLRFLVLVDKDLQSYLCPRVICKTCTRPFSIDNLTDKMAHLSTESVQSGKSATEVEQIAKWLSGEYNASFESTVMEPARDMIIQILDAAKCKLENVDHADFTSFQIFAFDFLLDTSLKLWFIETSAPSDFPEDIAPQLASDLIKLAIAPVFAGAGESAESPGDGQIFQRLASHGQPTSRSNNGSKK